MTAVAYRDAVACGEALLVQVACRDAMLAQLWIQRCRLSLVIVQNGPKFGDDAVTTNYDAVCNAAKYACAVGAHERCENASATVSWTATFEHRRRGRPRRL